MDPTELSLTYSQTYKILNNFAADLKMGRRSSGKLFISNAIKFCNYCG